MVMPACWTAPKKNRPAFTAMSPPRSAFSSNRSFHVRLVFVRRSYHHFGYHYRHNLGLPVAARGSLTSSDLKNAHLRSCIDICSSRLITIRTLAIIAVRVWYRQNIRNLLHREGVG